MKAPRFVPVVLLALLWQSYSPAADNPDAGDKATAVTSISIAIIDFESKAPGNPEIGKQIGDILTARLSIYDQFRLVERQKLEDLLREAQLNLSGAVDSDQAIKVGKIVGARIMVFGRAFPVDKDLYIVAKIVGVETSQVKGVMAKGSLEGNLSDVIGQVVEKLAEGLEEWAPQLLPKTEVLQSRIAVLKKQLAGRQLPKVAVVIPETHINREVADPAAETEIRKLFQEVGFTVIETSRKFSSEWARAFSEDPGDQNWKDFADADIVVAGEGFSEFGTRLGGLVSCSARLEVQAVDRQSRRVIISERTTRRAVDLSEAIAGKTALQTAGHELAIKLIERIASEVDPQQTGENI